MKDWKMQKKQFSDSGKQHTSILTLSRVINAIQSVMVARIASALALLKMFGLVAYIADKEVRQCYTQRKILKGFILIWSPST